MMRSQANAPFAAKVTRKTSKKTQEFCVRAGRNAQNHRGAKFR